METEVSRELDFRLRRPPKHLFLSSTLGWLEEQVRLDEDFIRVSSDVLLEVDEHRVGLEEGYR